MKVIFSRDWPTERQKVTAIKLYRNLTGSDLKTSKLVFDNVETNGRHPDNLRSRKGFKIGREEFNEFAANLHGTGYTVARSVEGSQEYRVYTEQLRMIASQAILAGHDDIAQDLMRILEIYTEDGN